MAPLTVGVKVSRLLLTRTTVHRGVHGYDSTSTIKDSSLAAALSQENDVDRSLADDFRLEELRVNRQRLNGGGDRIHVVHIDEMAESPTTSLIRPSQSVDRATGCHCFQCRQ